MHSYTYSPSLLVTNPSLWFFQTVHHMVKPSTVSHELLQICALVICLCRQSKTTTTTTNPRYAALSSAKQKDFLLPLSFRQCCYSSKKPTHECYWHYHAEQSMNQAPDFFFLEQLYIKNSPWCLKLTCLNAGLIQLYDLMTQITPSSGWCYHYFLFHSQVFSLSRSRRNPRAVSQE